MSTTSSASLRPKPKSSRALGFLVFLACVALACNGDDDLQVQPEFELPEWTEWEFTPATGTPQEQIDRFVELNDIDTTVTPSGLVYWIQEPGDGGGPDANDGVIAFYNGFLVDGRVFDNGSNRAQAFALDRVIAGWTEGLQLVGEGGRIFMLIRPALAYGNTGRPASGISSSTVLAFEVSLEEVTELE